MTHFSGMSLFPGIDSFLPYKFCSTGMARFSLSGFIALTGSFPILVLICFHRLIRLMYV